VEIIRVGKQVQNAGEKKMSWAVFHKLVSAKISKQVQHSGEKILLRRPVFLF